MPEAGRISFQGFVELLNPKQRAAYDSAGNTVLLAGPGSGKTATLVLRVARLLDEIPAPHGLACLTYSTEAAREFERRLSDFGIHSGGRFFTGTVHAFCLAEILRPFSHLLKPAKRFLAESEIASEDELSVARKKGLENAGINEPPSFWSSKLETYRRLALVDPALAAQLDDKLPEICEGYEAELRRIGRIDFDDVILGALGLVSNVEHVGRALAAKYPWLVVDEYQDLGLALHRIVVELLDRHGVQVFAVGDPDQSIYAFSGARPEFLDELANRPDVQVERLELNYRCRQQIIDGSLHVLQPETPRVFQAVEKDTLGEIIFKKCKTGLTEQGEYLVKSIRERLAAGTTPGEIAVLGKRWDDLHGVEKALADAQIPYRVVKGKAYRATAATMWMEDMAAWCAGGWRNGRPRIAEIFSGWARLRSACFGVQARSERLNRDVILYETLSPLRNPEIPMGTWMRAVVDGLQLEVLLQQREATQVRFRHELTQLALMVDSLRESPGSDQQLGEFVGTDRNKVILQSLHSSKGLEYSIVYMIALENGVIPQYRENPAEARRLFYVGMTRARREVHLLWSGFYVTTKGKRWEYGHSPFVEELWKRLHPND